MQVGQRRSVWIRPRDRFPGEEFRSRQDRRLTSRLEGSSLRGSAVASLISDRVRPISRSSYSDIRANSDIVRRAALTRAGQVRIRHRAFAAWEVNVNDAIIFASSLK